MSHRKLINEADIIDVLEKEGFKIIVPEQYIVEKQASIFSEAEYIIAPHGSGLTNLVFCNSGAKVFELFPPDYINVCLWTLSNHMSLEYFYATGTKPDTISVENGGQVDFYIDLSVIVQGIKQMGL